MKTFPERSSFDDTLAFLTKGYGFIGTVCRDLDTDAFHTRLMLRPVLCVSGAEAAEMFYHPDRFTRRGAMPPTALFLLQDRGSVQSLDAAAHRHRKALFMKLLAPPRLDPLRTIARRRFLDAIDDWQHRDHIVLHHEITRLLTDVACEWAGLPDLPAAESQSLAKKLAAMIENAGRIGPRNWHAQWLRHRAEVTARDWISDVRVGRHVPDEHSPLHALAWHRDLDGELLPEKIAAVELLNLLRPIVAVSRFIAFAALALHDHPRHIPRIEAGEEPFVEAFANEVRRYYPFFPVIGGRVRSPFTWRGHAFSEGDWVVLDLYGTNRDPRAWTEPASFDPSRFLRGEARLYNFAPQGAGDHATTHRCPGEWITIELLKLSLKLFTRWMRYEVPQQDLTIPLDRFPTLPASGVILTRIEPCHHHDCGETHAPPPVLP